MFDIISIPLTYPFPFGDKQVPVYPEEEYFFILPYKKENDSTVNNVLLLS